MKPKIRVSAFDGGLELFKIPREWERDLSISVVKPGKNGRGKKIEFPADQDRIAIAGLDPDILHQVNVGPSNLFKRLRRGVEKFEVRPECAAFRVIISGSGRCGTTTLAEYLNGMQFLDGQVARAQHETLHEYILPWILKNNPRAIQRFMTGQEHNIESAPYFALIPQLIKADTVVHLVRDGRRVCQSGMNRQWYAADTDWNRIKPDFPGTTFVKICHFWRHTNEQLESINSYFVRLENLADDELTRRNLLRKIGLQDRGVPFPHSNKGANSSSYDAWTDEMKTTFTNICGSMMDRYYPGWQQTW